MAENDGVGTERGAGGHGAATSGERAESAAHSPLLPNISLTL